MFNNAPFKQIITIDWETYWDSSEYTLSKMTTEEYIRDPRFSAHGACLHEFGTDKITQWYRYDEIGRVLKTYDWSKTAMLAHNCLTGDHQVRTRRGWVRLDLLQDGEDVLQWDPDTAALTFTPAVIVRQPYEGPLVTWDTTYHKGGYTPNHRMYYQTPGHCGWRVACAEDVAKMGPNNVYIPTAGVYTPEHPLDVTPLEARVLEMVRADGNVTPAMDARFHFRREEKVARCTALLDALGVTYGVRKNAGGTTAIWTHANEALRTLCRSLGAGKNKALGPWVLELSVAAREAWLDEVAYWDGHTASKKGRGQTSVFSAVYADAYWLGEMALLTGRAATLSDAIPNTRGFSRPDSVLYRANLRARSRAKLVEHATTYLFSGTVYCLTTPTQAFLVRRNGATWVTGNSQFDAAIAAWRYDVHPVFIFDSLSMARALRGIEVGNSLAKLAESYQLPPKGRAVHDTNGVPTQALTPSAWHELAEYCKHDVWLCEQIFSKLLAQVDPDTGLSRGMFPIKELRLIDMTIKMYTRAQLQLDQKMLQDAIEDERTVREGLLARLNIDEAALASNQKFAEVLESLGVKAPTKVSKTTGKPALALAKTDAMFQAMLHGDNEEVRLLCEARLKVKSTTERTRAQRFLDISHRGPLPVPLSYYGALSGRWTASKGSAINMQNLKRRSFLRKAIMAPDGHQLGVGDLSQIEPRVLAWLSDYEDMLRIFKAGGDPYAAFGAQMFNIPGMTKDSHPDLRQSAKSALLGAGYSLGWASFAGQLLTGFLGAPPIRYDKTFAKKLGVTLEAVEKFMANDDYMQRMAEIPHTCTDGELLIHCVAAKRIIDIYRATAWPVVAFWELCDSLMRRCLVGGEEVQYKCLTFRKEEIELPNGMRLRYPNLRIEETVDPETGRKEANYVYGEGKDTTKLYAGKITNNVTQALARIVMTDGMLRVSKRFFIAGTVHDELIAVVPDADAPTAKAWILEQMTKEPSYMPGIPLAADGGLHRRYGMAKD